MTGNKLQQINVCKAQASCKIEYMQKHCKLVQSTGLPVSNNTTYITLAMYTTLAMSLSRMPLCSVHKTKLQLIKKAPHEGPQNTTKLVSMAAVVSSRGLMLAIIPSTSAPIS